MPNVSGAWEFLLAPTGDPQTQTGLEVALQEGQMLDTSANGGAGSYIYTGQISASGAQVSFVTLTPGSTLTSPPNVAFGPNCPPATVSNGDSLSGSVSGLGGPMNFTFTENGNVFTVNAVLDATGQSIESGTYTAQSGTAQSGSGCNESGTIVSGKLVSKLSGTYTGKLCQPLDSSCAGTPDSATVTLSQSKTTLTASMVLSGTDNASITLTGPVAGNTFSVSGTFEGTTVTYYGYYELTYDKTTNAYDTQTIYLANAADPSVKAGLLTVPVLP